jgi:hypothetical protein
MIRKVFLILLALVLALSVGLVACGGAGQEEEEEEEEETYDLTIESSAGGSVTTPGEGTYPYNEGEAVDLVATPDDGYRFWEWRAPAGEFADANAAHTSFSMPAQDVTVTADFAERPEMDEYIEQWYAEQIDCKCDVEPLYEGQLVDGGRYYATGGGAARHDYDGVDIWAPVTAIPGTSIEGPMLIGMLHDEDWVVYHFKLAQDWNLHQIDLCLQNYKLPSFEPTEVEVYAMSGNDLPYQPHNADFQTTGWEGPWKINIDNVNWGKIYSVSVSPPIGPSSDFLVAVYLRDGTMYTPDSDHNVYICWINLVELDQPPQ